MTAAPITSAGRFSPGGPRGIFRLFLCCFCETVIVLCHLKQLVLGVYETDLCGQIPHLSRTFPTVLGIIKGHDDNGGPFDYVRSIQTEALPGGLLECTYFRGPGAQVALP